MYVYIPNRERGVGLNSRIFPYTVRGAPQKPGRRRRRAEEEEERSGIGPGAREDGAQSEG